MINIKEIQEALVNKLRPSGWTAMLKTFILSIDFESIITKLVKTHDDGKRFTPPLKLAFKAFEECNFDNLKVVIIGQDPYPQIGVADGLAFSCGLTGFAQPSLQKILDAVNSTVYEGKKISTGVDLSRWANQGVLLLNTALTTEVSKPGTHQEIWKNYISCVLDTIENNKSDIIFIFMGKKAQEWDEMISDYRHIKYNIPHPAYAAYNKIEWDCGDVFNETNRLLKDLNRGEIIW